MFVDCNAFCVIVGVHLLVNFEMGAEDIPHDDKIILNAINCQPVHSQILWQQCASMLFDDVWMVVLEERMHTLDLLTC